MRSNCARTPPANSVLYLLYSPVQDYGIVLLFLLSVPTGSMFDMCHGHGRCTLGEFTRDYDQGWVTSTRNLDILQSNMGRKSPRRRSVIICLMDAQAHPWKNFRKSRKRKRKHLNRKRRKHISPNGSMTDIRQMDFCASTSPSGSLSTQKDLADIQYSYLNPHFRAVVAAFVKQPCLTGELHKCNRPVCQSCFPHCSRKSARFFLCH